MAEAGGAGTDQNFGGAGRIEFALFDGEGFGMGERNGEAGLAKEGGFERDHLLRVNRWRLQ